MKSGCSDRGQIMILVVGGMIGLLMLGGLAVDVGIWYRDQRSIEHAAELAALAGYKELIKQQGVLQLDANGALIPGDPVRMAVEECLQVNGVAAGEVTTISVDKQGNVKIWLKRVSPAMFTRITGKKNTAIAGRGKFKTNRIAPFAIPEQYNDEDRDQAPNYDPSDTVNQFITSPYVNDTNCSYVLGNPYILLYSVATAETTYDWVFIPMDDTPARIPIGNGIEPSIAYHNVHYETPNYSGQSHVPCCAGDVGDYPFASREGDYYELWQDSTLSINADNEVDRLYTYSLFRAYGICWDVLGADDDNGDYPFVRWFLGFNGGAFAVQRRFLERAGFALVHEPHGNGLNQNDYYRIVRTSNRGFPNGEARKAAPAGVDTGVKCVLLRFGDYGENFHNGGGAVDRDDGDGTELSYIRWRIRSVAFWRLVGSIADDKHIKLIDFGKGTTSQATRVQPRIATYTGTTDPVTRVLGWAGIPFDAFFREYNPRIDLDPKSSCKESYCLRTQASVDLTNPASITNFLRNTKHYHWLHIHHENFAHAITDTTVEGAEVRALAQAIRNFVAEGGYLFDACLGAETIEAALGYLSVQNGQLQQAYGPFSNTTDTEPLAHSDFRVVDVNGTPRLYNQAGSHKLDIVDQLTGPSAGDPSTVWGSFTLSDPLNPRNQNHTGFKAGTPYIDFTDASGTCPQRFRTVDEALNLYTGSVMTFDETALKTPVGTPKNVLNTLTGENEFGPTLEYCRKKNADKDVYFSLGLFRESNSYTNPNALTYFSGTVSKANGSSHGQFAMIGGHIPHHAPYNVCVKENFIEGAWYHRNSTHIPWKISKTHRGDYHNRGDGYCYDNPNQPAADAQALPSPEDMTIAWRGALGYNRYIFYTPKTTTWWAGRPAGWNPAPHWDSGWRNGAWNNGNPYWVTPPGWTTAPYWITEPWVEAGKWLVDPYWWEDYVLNPKGSWGSDPENSGQGMWLPAFEWQGWWTGGTWWGGQSTPGNWYGGDWYGGDWWGDTSWVAQWWEGWNPGWWDPGEPGALRQTAGWRGNSNAFGGVYRRTDYLQDAWCDDYFEVLGNLVFRASGWWDNPWYHHGGNTASNAMHQLMNDNYNGDHLMRTPVSISIGSAGDDVLDYRGHIVSVNAADPDHAVYKTRFDTEYYPSLDNRVPSTPFATTEWGKGWPTLYSRPGDEAGKDVDLNDNTSYTELYDTDNRSNDPYYFTFHRRSNILASSINSMTQRPATARPADCPGGNTTACYITCDGTANHVPDWNDPDWDSFQSCLPFKAIIGVDINGDDYWRGYTRIRFAKGTGSEERDIWSLDGNHNYLFYHGGAVFHGGFLNLPRWLQFQCLLHEKRLFGRHWGYPGLKGVFEIHGYDMCVRDLDNDGITGDIYEKGAIYRGVPDIALHRLYLNNVLLGAMAATIEVTPTGGLNTGAVNWDFMNAADFADDGAPFGDNSFVDIMRLGLKGGGLALGDVYSTSPGDLERSVDKGEEYMFTDASGLVRTSVTWADYVNRHATVPHCYYDYVGGTGLLYDSPVILNASTNTIDPGRGVFRDRPAQVMTVPVVERTDKTLPNATSDRSFYYSDPGGSGANIQVRVIGFARFFIIDPDTDSLTYNAVPGQHVPSLCRRNDNAPENADQPANRETLYLGPEPNLKGEIRGHFMGWEIKPPHP